jgi:phospholipid-binding lipoprotein MlaA
LTVLKAVDKRAKVLDAGRLVDEVSLDKYAFIRDAYLQRRRQGQDAAPEEHVGGPAADRDTTVIQPPDER